MRYTPIVGTLGFVLSPDKKKVLMIHRNAREDDEYLGKYNGLGGKMAMNEDVAACMKREIFEEAGIEVVQMRLRGTINWTGFGPKNENWLGFVFIIDEFKGIPHEKSLEGDLEWVDITSMGKLPMWEGDKYFLPLVFDGDPRIFHGYLPYNGDVPLEWVYHRL